MAWSWVAPASLHLVLRHVHVFPYLDLLYILMYSYTVFLQLLSSLVNLAPKVHAMQDYSKIDRIVTLGEGLAPEISIYFVYDFL